tara:strand:- start:564 stop:1235 length:672 start_codon:yes stop_codon:yes gene_type:complete
MTQTNKEESKKSDLWWKDRDVTVIPVKRTHPEPWWEIYDKSAIDRRHWFVNEILKFEPESILELGCCGGCNIQLFPEDKLKDINIIGVDCNSGAIQYAKEKNLPVHFIEADITKPFDFLPVSSVDIVCSMGVLIHMREKEIDFVLANMLEVANVGLVLAETAGPEKTFSGNQYNPRHVYDLPTRIRAISSDVEITVTPLPKKVNTKSAKASEIQLITVLKPHD